jgi:DNA replicative helicase MCM subunit Mcm2 (Cdc46/Mcm family)
MSDLTNLQDKGFNVVPLKSKSKEPITGLNWKQFQEGRYNGTYPTGCNYAVICGKTSGNLFVVDLDDESLIINFADIETYTVKTGKGYHLYFYWVGFAPPNKKLDDKRGRHIDIKSQGGYVLGAGSIHPDTGKSYEVIKDVPIKKIEYSTILEKLKEMGFNVETRPIDDIANGISEGGRNDSTFKYACYLIRDKGLFGMALAHEIGILNQKHQPPLPQSELDLIISQAEKAETKNRLKHIEDTRNVVEQLSNKPMKVMMQDITPILENKRIEFDCMITAVGERETYTKRATFECPLCNDRREVVCDDLYQISIPYCMDDRRKYVVDSDTMETAYIQKLRIQEFLEMAKNATPVEFNAIIIDEAVGEAFLGDRKTVTSKFRSIPQQKGYNLIIHQILDMRDMDQKEGCLPTPEEVSKWSDHVDIFGRVTASIAPDIYINPMIIQSLILWACGGNSLNNKRDLIHMTILGDAQLGKSELAIKMHKLLPGSGMTVGRNTSGAGLTIGMVKLYDGTSIPKAGFFPQHTNHQCIIDEGDKMRREEQNSCLEVMEQMTTTLTKNGVPSLTLPTRCPLLFLGNPKNGKYNDKYPTLMDNFEMETPFISRFDILWLLVDENNPETDAKIRSFIRSYESRKGEYMSVEELQRYFAYITNLNATISEEMKDKIDELHKRIRVFNTKEGSIPIGNRQYHGLYRLVTASAKAHLRTEVNIDDLELVEELIRQSYKSMNMDIDTGEMKSTLLKSKDVKENSILEAIGECIQEVYGNTLAKEELITVMGLKGIKNPQKIVEDFITNGTLELDDDWQRYRKRI